MTPPDRDLWDDFCRAPGERSFEPLFEATKGLVYTICVRVLGDREDAQDAFQSTYCRLLALAADRRGRGASDEEEGLVARLAMREADNLRKRRWRHRRREIGMETPPVAPDPRPPADEVLERKQLRAEIEKIVSALPDRYRVPLSLHYLDGRSPAQIAAATGVPSKTVYSRISRGLKRLGPRLRAAGLSGGAAGIAALPGTGDLLPPPPALSAAVVFSRAQRAVALGSSAAGGAATSGLAGLLLGATMKGKVSVIVGIALALLFGAAILRNQSPPPPESAVASRPGSAPAVGALEPATVPSPRPAAEVTAPTALRGRVVLDGTLTPVAGAEVVLRPSREPLPDGARVETDARGEFELSDVAPGEYQLVAASEQLVSAVVAFRFPPERDEPITLPLRHDRALTVRVRSEESGRPIASARVAIRAGRARSEGSTDEAGTVRFSGLDPDEYVVEVTHARRARFRQSVNLETRAESVLEVTLPPGGSIHGVITDAAGRPVATRLSYHFIGSSTLKGEAWGEDSAPDGAYRIDHLPLGVKVGLSFGSGEFERVSREVELDGSDPVREIDVTLTPAATGSIGGTVTDAAKEPVGNALVTYGRPGPPEGDPHTYTAPDGSFRLDDLPRGRKSVFLTVQAPGFAPKQIDAEPGPAGEPPRVHVVLEPGHWIKGRVVDQDGEPLEGVAVQPHIEHNMIYQSLPQKTKTDSRGRFELDGLPARSVFSFYASGYSSEYGWQRLELDRDDVEVELLSTGGVISGRVLDEESRQPIRAFRIKLDESVRREPGDRKASGISLERQNAGVHFDSPDGTFRLDGLAVGAPLFLTVEAAGYPVRAFDRVMAQGGDAEPLELLVSKRGRSLRGRVLLGSGEPVDGATVLVLVYRESERTGRMEVERYGIWSLMRNQAIASVRLLERSLATDAQGRFSAPDLPHGHPVDLFIRSPAIAQTYVSRLEELPDSSWDDLVVEVEVAASVRGSLDRESCREADEIILRSSDNPLLELRRPLEGDAATFEFAELPPGRYEALAVGPRQGLWSPLPVLTRRELHLEAGERAEVRLGSGATFALSGTISVRGKPLASGEVVLVAGDRGRWFRLSSTTDGEGRYSFPRVEPGSYDLVAFETPDPGTGAVLESPNRLRVEVRDEDLRRDPSFPGAGTVTGRITAFPAGFARWRSLSLVGSKERAGGGNVWRNIVLETPASFSFADLPPDTYRLEYRTSTTTRTLRESIALSEDRRDVDLGEIAIE